MGTGTYRHGIRANLLQFSLQLLVVFAVGATIGAEKTVVSKLGESVFGVGSILVLGTFVVSFGFVKAAMNLLSGYWAERSRKRVLTAGWLVAVPIPFMLIFADNWWWVVAANVLLGINQGLTFSMTINGAIDLAGKGERGLAVGLIESVGYGGVAVSAWLTGVIAEQYGLHPEPFYVLAVIVAAGLIVTLLFVRDTIDFVDAEHETGSADSRDSADSSSAAGSDISLREAIVKATVGDRTLFAACQAGHVEKFVDALVWIAFPLYLTDQGLTLGQVGAVVFAYNGTWALLQIPTGRLADRIGRRIPIVSGMFLAGAGVLATVSVSGYPQWLLSGAITGAGIALLYPNLQAVFGDAAHPSWRATGIGVYRMWRDAGYGIGAIAIGIVADLSSAEAAFYMTAVAMGLSGLLAALWLRETHPTYGKYRNEQPLATRTPADVDDD